MATKAHHHSRRSRRLRRVRKAVCGQWLLGQLVHTLAIMWNRSVKAGPRAVRAIGSQWPVVLISHTSAVLVLLLVEQLLHVGACADR
jgi:hypothetical protein